MAATPLPNHAPAPAAPSAEALEAFADVSAAVESGAGLPAVARAAARALDASIAVLDAQSSVLAVACLSPADERLLLSNREGTHTIDLKVAAASVGELRHRPRGETLPPPVLLRMAASLIALELERSSGPERATEAAVAEFLGDVLDRRLTDRDNIVARGRELGADLGEGGTVVIVRSRPHQPEQGDWRGRVLAVAERTARLLAPGALAAAVDRIAGRTRPGAAAAKEQGDGRRVRDHAGELVIVVPGPDADRARRATEAVANELEARFPHHGVAIARSRPAGDPTDLHRAGAEALLAANVAEAQGRGALAFEETGAYRLLLSAMSEDAGELERFYHETVAPLVAYDDHYETELVRTLDTFLDSDASVAGTAQRLFTHRHTIRYRLERVRELTGLDVNSTDGRERLGLGLKAMRVLGLSPPGGPAAEPGAEGGRVPRDRPDR